MADPRPHLLFVDDEADLRGPTAERLTDRGFEVVEAASGEQALELLDQFAFDLVVTDFRLPGMDGTQLIDAARQRYPSIVAIVITGYGTVRDAVEAIKKGASDFITKPFHFDELMHVIQKSMEQGRLRSENAYLRSQLEERYQFEGIIGRSRAMQPLFSMLETVARTTSTVLITGETGTGKEVIAKAIHHNSPRKTHKFVAINCGAIPETLLEAELFGHERGAFTGAVGMRQGRFEQASKGTIFLDEVGTMSLGLQTKLLRALQERAFERVGGNQTIKVDVRVIAATNSALQEMIKEGSFRADLYFRLNVIPITLPPLRDRREDIPLLVAHFLKKFAPDAPPQMSQSAMRSLMAYPWPGNVRQLENAIERAVTLSGGRTEIDVTDLLPEMQDVPPPTATPYVDLPDEGMDLSAYLSSLERDLIKRALDRTRGNRNKASEVLHIKRTTLVEKMKRLGLE
ncbi:MAG TPA: sigma-54 dependent transcriptional regulator [Vicinamibacterales bacterium]|nr:sigma-54 dependent transcriptional regulator [Vicinamibacterales bacterium]